MQHVQTWHTFSALFLVHFSDLQEMSAGIASMDSDLPVQETLELCHHRQTQPITRNVRGDCMRGHVEG